MGKIFITGSSDGLGLLAAKKLVSNGHTVYLHARNSSRADDARKACPGAADVLIGDLSSQSETRSLARSISDLGPLDCIFHNAGLYTGPYRATSDGFPAVFAVNAIAPYLLTCLAPAPRRLVYVSSGWHRSGSADVDGDFGHRGRGEHGFSATQAYADTKLYSVMFAHAFARRFEAKGTTANVVDPGWVPTKMGGQSAMGDIGESERLYVALAEGKDDAEGANARLFENGKKGPVTPNKDALDENSQERLLKKLEEITGVKVPE